VARALAADPDVLLMDEPFGALDPVTRGAMQQELLRIHALSGKTVVLVTHDIDEALQLGSHVVLMNQGKVVQQGRPLDLLRHPANAFVHDFVGRAEIGIRLLALDRVAGRLRPGEAASGEPICADLSLREALSAFVARRVDRLPVVDRQGRPAGALFFSDLLERQT
jgi:osmoprotectant transport system ATP-binding protein